jgi:hypothetical protein
VIHCGVFTSLSDKTEQMQGESVRNPNFQQLRREVGRPSFVVKAEIPTLAAKNAARMGHLPADGNISGNFRTPKQVKGDKMRGLPVGAFVTNRLAEGKRVLARTRNTAGFHALIAEVARLVAGEYPMLSPTERTSVFATLRREGDALHRATGQYPAVALREASRVLRIPGGRGRGHDNL